MFKDKINRQDQKHKSYQVVHSKALCLKENCRKGYKYEQCYNLLNNLQLYKGKRPAMQVRAYTVCRNLKAVLKKGNKPTDSYYTKQSPLWKHFVCSKLQMAIPRNCHKAVGYNKKQY